MNKAMRKILFVFAVVAGLCSCSKEDWFEDIQPEINFFAVPEDATGEEADLRRDFFEETSIYLLFNDTLGVREVPTLSGTAQNYQVVNLFWDMNVGDAYPDSLELFYYRDMAEKSAAAQFLQEEVFGSLPELFYPYSVLALDRLVRYTNTYGAFGEGEEISTFAGMQSTAVALGDVAHLGQEDRERLVSDIIGQIVISRIDLIPDEEFADFYAYSAGYYDSDMDYYDVPTPVESVGFLDTYTLSWGVTFNSESNDKLAFVEKIFELTEEEFRTTYSEYPIVINKMEEMVRVLREYGVNVYE